MGILDELISDKVVEARTILVDNDEAGIFDDRESGNHVVWGFAVGVSAGVAVDNMDGAIIDVIVDVKGDTDDMANGVVIDSNKFASVGGAKDGTGDIVRNV